MSGLVDSAAVGASDARRRKPRGHPQFSAAVAGYCLVVATTPQQVRDQASPLDLVWFLFCYFRCSSKANGFGGQGRGRYNLAARLVNPSVGLVIVSKSCPGYGTEDAYPLGNGWVGAGQVTC